MKLSGNSKHGKHINTMNIIEDDYYGRPDYQEGEPVPEKKKNIGVRIIIIVLVVLLAIAAAGYAFMKIGIKPPSINAVKRVRKATEQQEQQEGGDGTHSSDSVNTANRNGSKYTFLCLGMDDGNGNTDTIMVATLDTEEYSFNVVNIPRDTLVNVPWDYQKANTMYAYSGIDSTIEYLADILGYEVDHYAIIDLDAFAELVDSVGGIYYDVPIDMDYDDPFQDLYIHVAAGEQWLDGKTALGVVRYRYGYADADIGRISTQQDFLKTAISQILENKNSIKLTSIIKIITQDVKTDLSYGNLAWFAQEFLKISPDKVSFTTLPANYGDSIGGISFVTIYVDEWLQVLNEKLNPFDEPITEGELSILTRNSEGCIYSTNGVYADGSGSYYDGGYYDPDDDYEDEPYEDEPSDDPSDDPTDEPTDDPSDDPADEPSDEPYDDPSDEPSEEPYEEPEDDPGEGEFEEGEGELL